MEYSLVNQGYRDLNPILFGSEDCAPGHAWGPSTRPYYLVHLITKGTGVFHRGGVSHTLHAGQCFVGIPGEDIFYEADRTDPWSYIWIGFETALPLPERMVSPVLESATAARLLTEVHDALVRGVSQPEILLSALLWRLYAHFVSQDAAFGADLSHTEMLMRRAKNVIETEYMLPLTVTALASRLHLERSYFSTLFKRYFGTSPQAYLVSCRLHAARELLLSHRYTPGQAARAVGYSDLCNFSRMYRRTFGVSPSETAAKG